MENKKAIQLLKESREVLSQYINECGGCDHSVGICMCWEIGLLYDIDLELKKESGIASLSELMNLEFSDILLYHIQAPNSLNDKAEVIITVKFNETGDSKIYKFKLIEKE